MAKEVYKHLAYIIGCDCDKKDVMKMRVAILLGELYIADIPGSAWHRDFLEYFEKGVRSNKNENELQ